MQNMYGGGMGGMGGMGGQGLGGLGGFGGLGGLGGFGQQQQGDPKELYKTQLEQLQMMGFTNESVNIEALKATGGNVEAAVERLLTMLS
jgi:ubiquilin